MGLSVIIALLFFAGATTEELFIIWAYLLVAVCAFAAIFFPIMRMVKYPKNAVKALVGLGGLVVIFLVGFLFADATPIVSVIANPNFSDPSALLLADTGIISTYILFSIAVLALLFTGVRSILNY